MTSPKSPPKPPKKNPLDPKAKPGKFVPICGDCFAQFSPHDWSDPVAALKDHYASGKCPGPRA